MTSDRSLLISLVFSITILGSQAIPSSRILGGGDVSRGKYPWVASIRIDGIHVCSGSIINDRYIVTAARCVSPFDNFRVTGRIGSINHLAGGKLVNFESAVIHPAFGNFLHDIALLRVAETLTFSENINKIPLAREDDVMEEGTQIFVTGWGLQENESSSYKLKQLSMSVLSGSQCEQQAGYGYYSVICLSHPEKTGICRGDEGAGVVSGQKLVGVASFSFANCGTKYPDVSSNISYYIPWINSVIG